MSDVRVLAEVFTNRFPSYGSMIRTVTIASVDTILAIPMLIAWIVAIVFAVRMMRRGGGGPEHLLLIGVSLMLFGSIINVVTSAITDYLANSSALNGTSTYSEPFVFLFIFMFRYMTGLAGIVCVVCAFWLKFNRKRKVES